MSKAYWEDFWWRWTRTIVIIAIAFVAGLALGHILHPYESCNRMYETPEDVSECIWIKEH